MLFDELRSKVNQGTFGSQQVSASGMRRMAELREGIDCFVEDWKDLIGDTDRYLAKERSPVKSQIPSLTHYELVAGKKRVELQIERTAIMPELTTRVERRPRTHKRDV